MPQPQAKNFWNFIENSVDDFGNGLAVGVLVAGYGIYWLGDKAAEALRPAFGQSSGAVVLGAGITAVTVAGVTYIIRKRRDARDNDSDNGRHPNQPAPQPPILDRILNLVQHRQLDDVLPDTAVLEQASHEGVAAVQPTSADLDESWEMIDHAKDADHIFIVSGTGAGKTVFATAVMQGVVRDGGSYFAVDGKPGMNWEMKWPGASGKIKDPNEFVRFLKAAVAVMEKRIRFGAARFPPLYIIIDEARDVTGKFEEAVKAVADLSSKGREFNVHVWLMTQAGTVNEIGFDGSTPILEMNFEAMYLEKISDNERTFGFARFRNGGIRPFGKRYTTPTLPAPWADVSNLPAYDDSGEFGGFQTTPRPVQAAVSAPVQGSLHHPQNGRVPEVVACDQPAPVRVVQAVQPHETESDKIRSTARWMIESMTGESAYPIGSRFLTVGESSAIFYLNQMEWTQNEIIEFVLGAKNSQRLAAVAGVLNGERNVEQAN